MAREILLRQHRMTLSTKGLTAKDAREDLEKRVSSFLDGVDFQRAEVMISSSAGTIERTGAGEPVIEMWESDATVEIVYSGNELLFVPDDD